MKIAIPIFQGRVSPVFDWSTRLLVIEFDKTEVVDRVENSLTDSSPVARADFLEAMGVEVLLCGGVSANMQYLFKNRRIQVVPWIAGDVDEVIVAFLKGDIPGEKFAMPGCCMRRNRLQGMGHGRMKRRSKQGKRGRGPGGPAGQRKES